LLARQPIELLRFRNAELPTQTITTHKSLCKKVSIASRGAKFVAATREIASPELLGLFVSKLTSNPVLDAGLQHVERQTSSAENFIMEGPDIELSWWGRLTVVRGSTSLHCRGPGPSGHFSTFVGPWAESPSIRPAK
jgi:hypothetical protein